MVNGCDFCSKIWDNVKEYKESFEFEHEEREAIVMNGHRFGWYIPCDDPWYSRIIMDLNFCPVCGRQVDLNYKVQR